MAGPNDVSLHDQAFPTNLISSSPIVKCALWIILSVTGIKTEGSWSFCTCECTGNTEEYFYLKLDSLK